MYDRNNDEDILEADSSIGENAVALNSNLEDSDVYCLSE